MCDNKNLADLPEVAKAQTELQKLSNQKCLPALYLSNLIQALIDGNQVFLINSVQALIKILKCEHNTLQLICPYQNSQQNYGLFLSNDFTQNLKKNQMVLKNFVKQGVDTSKLQLFNETVFCVATKLQEKHLQCKEQFGHANPPSVKADRSSSPAVADSKANDGKSSDKKTLYQQDVSLNSQSEAFTVLANDCSTECNQISKIRAQVPVIEDKSKTDSANNKQKSKTVDDFDSNNNGQATNDTNGDNNKQEIKAVEDEVMYATEKPTNVSEKDIVVYFDLLCQESVLPVPYVSWNSVNSENWTYMCRFFLVKKEKDDFFQLTEFTKLFFEKKLLPIDISSRTSAHNALFASNLVNNGNLSVRQAVAVMDVLGIHMSKTGIQNLKETVDISVFMPAARAIEAFIRELIDFAYADETHFRHLSEMKKGARRRKNNSFLQQICSGPNSNIQCVLFKLLDSRTKQCMDDVIDFASFENLKGFESDGLKQYQDYVEIFKVKFQRCLAHAFRYTKAIFIDLLQCTQQNFEALNNGKITQEQFDAFIKSKQNDLNLDEYDLHLFEIAYAMQTIFYVEEQAKAEASSIIEAKTATDEEAKQIRLQVTDKYRKDFVSPLRQIIECNINKLKALSEENRMLSSTQLKPLTYLSNAIDSLFTFIDTPELEAHNNNCEANFKDLLRVRRNNNDLASSKEELERIAHFRTLVQTLKINGFWSFKEQLAFQYSLHEAQFKNAVNQAATLIWAVHTPAKDPKTGFYDITAFIQQFKIAHFTDTFNCNKFMFDLMTSKGGYFPLDLDDNLNRLFKREELTIQIKREQLLETYLHRFKFDSRLEEIKLAYPKLFNCDAAKAELDKMDLESQARRKARQKKSSASNTADSTITNQIKSKSLSTNKSRRQRMTKRVPSSSISQASVNNDEKCSYGIPTAS